MPTKRIVCLGLNHRTAPVELRERLSCTLDDIVGALQWHSSVIGEIALLATCNRVEVYACVEADRDGARALLLKVLTAANATSAEDFLDHIYLYSDDDAVTHLCKVAAGLDSLVLGETQILGQVTQAHRRATDLSTSGADLSRVFRTAIRVGKRARSETAIGTSPASMSSVAIALAQNVVGDLGSRRVLVIGLGEMGTLTLKVLHARGVKNVTVANRTHERAIEVAAKWGFTAHPFERRAELLPEADVVITTTGAPGPVIDAEMMRTATTGRDGRDLVFIDIAVPRDVDPAIGDLSGIRLFDTDDLRSIVDKGIAARRQEVPRVEKIIAEEINAYRAATRKSTVAPLIADLRHKAESIRRHELERTLNHLGDIDDNTRSHIQHLSRSLVNKLLHEPTAHLKDRTGNGDDEVYASAVRELFGLPDPSEHDV